MKKKKNVELFLFVFSRTLGCIYGDNKTHTAAGAKGLAALTGVEVSASHFSAVFHIQCSGLLSNGIFLCVSLTLEMF